MFIWENRVSEAIIYNIIYSTHLSKTAIRLELTSFIYYKIYSRVEKFWDHNKYRKYDNITSYVYVYYYTRKVVEWG